MLIKTENKHYIRFIRENNVWLTRFNFEFGIEYKHGFIWWNRRFLRELLFAINVRCIFVVWKLKCENMCGTSKVPGWYSVRDSLNFSCIDHIHRLFSVWKTCLRRVHAIREPLKRSIPYDVEGESTMRNKGRVSNRFDKAALALFPISLIGSILCDKNGI